MDINTYVNEYLKWLKSEITYTEKNTYYEMNFPFLDNNNDYLQFYVKFEGDKAVFTDDRVTINNLINTGFNYSGTRKKQLEDIARQFGVKVVDKEMTMTASIAQFAQNKHMFIQCMMKIADMYMLSRSRVASLFSEDIENFFKEKNIYSVSSAQFVGESGFAHNYDFVLQKSKNNPERMCLAMNHADKANVGNAIFAWNDTKNRREKDSKLIVFVNDRNSVGQGTIEALGNYGIDTIKWNDRYNEKNLNKLTA